MYEFFIRRPIVAICTAIVIILLGAFSISKLPVAEYPNVLPPTIMLSASYPGADSETIVKSIASPIEQQISGVEDMSYMSSMSSNSGDLSLTVVFEIGSQPNIDEVMTYLRYGQAVSQLPSEVQALGPTLRKSSGMPTLVFSLYSPEDTYDGLWLSNYAYINLVDPVKRIKGVGEVQVFGSGQYAMRIWLNPEKLSAYNISVSEVKQAISAQNNVNPAGKIGAQPSPSNQQFTYTVKAPGRLVTVEQFENIVVSGNNDTSAIVRLKDVARVELGAQSYDFNTTVNGSTSASVCVYVSPDANAIDMVNKVKELLDAEPFPPGMEYLVSLDATQSVRVGIKEIVQTLFTALGLVVIVVFVFLQGWRGTIIPAFAIPVSIIGGFIIFPFIGFNINTICLMGMVLAIGLVVDDAIVVVEAVQAHIQEGMAPVPATVQAMKEVAGPVVSTALVIACVFLPTLLLPGVTGLLFEQFAVTIGFSILISALCALSLSPALSSRLLHDEHAKKRLLDPLYDGFNKLFDKVRQAYVDICSFLIKHIWVPFIILAGILIALFPIQKAIPAGFLPNEDQGFLLAGIQMPPNTSLNQTAEVSAKTEKLLKDIPGVETVTTVNGFNLMSMVQNSYNCVFFISLKPWSERNTPSMTAASLCGQMNEKMGANVISGIPYAIQPPPIPGIGTSGDISFLLEDRKGIGENFLTENTDQFIIAAQKKPEIASITNFMSPSNLQYNLNVDTAQATLQGVPISDIYNTIQAYMGSMYINNFNIYGQQWQVYMQADSEFRNDIDKINLYYVKNQQGDAVPLTSVVDVEHGWAPEFLMRQNQYNCSMLNVTPAAGCSTGQVMDALESTFQEVCPTGMGYDYSGMSFQESQARKGISMTTIFIASAIFVYLILASLYESWSLPIAIFITVPFALFGSMVGLYMFGQQMNIYSSIGLLMIIALSAKNAILIVEFAVLELKAGKNLMEATVNASRIRFRPILMTSFAFIFGCLPLAIATGAGAAARQSVGICVIGGMISAITLGILLIPPFFYFVGKRVNLEKRLNPPPGTKVDDTPI